jgi:8-oxo-dGTP pyrophosphatase MutT (NUDIX family)
MSLLQHIRACNAYDETRFLPLVHDGAQVGLVRRDNAQRLRRFDIFRVDDDVVTLCASGGFEAVSAAVDAVVETLVEEGVLPRWRNEFFAVAPRWGATPHFRLDRGAVPFFGTRAYGVHLNGYQSDDAGLRLWIGRRATSKQVAPGKLDNLVAGGISYEHGLYETLVKESDEEAGLPPDLVARAVPVGAISYRMETKQGVRNDVLFVYDLEVPRDFTPSNSDGELTDFSLMSSDETIARVRAGDDFKFNVNLVIIDFALRHGLVSPDEPDYLELVVGLRRPLRSP